jgi:hypothetical protein
MHGKITKNANFGEQKGDDFSLNNWSDTKPRKYRQFSP